MESRPQIRGNPQTDFARKAQIRQPNPANSNTAKRPITLAAQDLGSSSQTTIDGREIGRLSGEQETDITLNCVSSAGALSANRADRLYASSDNGSYRMK
jgi:hypothetical protein